MNEKLKEKIEKLEKLSKQFLELSELAESLKDYSKKWDNKVFNKRVITGLQDFTRQFINQNCPALKDSNFMQYRETVEEYNKLSVYWYIGSMNYLECKMHLVTGDFTFFMSQPHNTCVSNSKPCNNAFAFRKNSKDELITQDNYEHIDTHAKSNVLYYSSQYFCKAIDAGHSGLSAAEYYRQESEKITKNIETLEVTLKELSETMTKFNRLKDGLGFYTREVLNLKLETQYGFNLSTYGFKVAY